jgi:hypothetical protein
LNPSLQGALYKIMLKQSRLWHAKLSAFNKPLQFAKRGLHFANSSGFSKGDTISFHCIFKKFTDWLWHVFCQEQNGLISFLGMSEVTGNSGFRDVQREKLSKATTSTI